VEERLAYEGPRHRGRRCGDQHPRVRPFRVSDGPKRPRSALGFRPRHETYRQSLPGVTAAAKGAVPKGAAATGAVVVPNDAAAVIGRHAGLAEAIVSYQSR